MDDKPILVDETVLTATELMTQDTSDEVAAHSAAQSGTVNA